MDRFWAKVNADADCWRWMAAHSHDGYGQFSLAGKILYAHRVAWDLLIGPIPDGYQLDHLCRNRGCVNPDHLEPVLPGENTRRAPWSQVERGKASSRYRAAVTHCVHGHPFDEVNTHIQIRNGRPKRRCRKCDALYAQRRRS